MTVDRYEALDRTARLFQDYVSLSESEITDALTQFRVRLAADEASLRSQAGRVALLSAFDSVARLGVEVVLAVSNIEMPTPPGYQGGSIRKVLLDRSRKLITPASLEGEADLEVALGEPTSPGAIVLGGTDTGARLRIGEWAGGWQGSLPIGGGLAGAMAGAEVARAVLAELRGSRPDDQIELEHRSVDFWLPPIAICSTPDLRGVDFVSGGAITNAVLFLLFQVDGLRMSARVFDDDVAHADNLNRYFMLTGDDLGKRKVEQLEELSSARIQIAGIDRRIVDLQSLGVDAPLASVVCVGTDWVEGRWAAQELAAGWLGIGATSHSYVEASEHVPGYACAGCLHPLPGDHLERMPTISFVSLLAGTLLTHRLLSQAVSPAEVSSRTQVLDCFNLASSATVLSGIPEINPHCRLGH